MSKKKTLKPSLTTVKPSNNKGLFIPLVPQFLTFETAKLPDWIALVLFDLVQYPRRVPSLCLPVLPEDLNNMPVFHVYYATDVLEEDAPENVCFIYVDEGEEQNLLDLYLQAYREDSLPVQHYKTFEKSLRATLDFLQQAENDKGSKFGLDGLPPHPKDVRFYSDLVYLHQRGMLELKTPDLFMISSPCCVPEVEVQLKMSVSEMEEALLPHEPDCQYRKLQFFAASGKFVYGAKEYKVHNMNSKWVQLLLHMMQHKVRFPWSQAVKMLKIQKKAKDSDGKKALESILRESANTHLRQLGFPQQLGLTEKNVVWKDLK